jgi:hypothetical protein
VLHQERIERDPVLPVDDLAQPGFRFLGRLSTDDAEPVRDPVDVRVDRDGGDPVAKDEHAVRGLRPDAGERRQLIERRRHRTPEPVEDRPSAGANRPGLDAVEARRADQGLDIPGRGAGERSGVGIPVEESSAGRVRVRILGPLGKDGAYENLERILRMVAEVRGPPIPGPVEGREPVEDPLPVERARPRGRAHRGRPGDRGAGRAARGDGSGRVGSPRPGSERSGSSSSGLRRSSPMR